MSPTNNVKGVNISIKSVKNSVKSKQCKKLEKLV